MFKWLLQKIREVIDKMLGTTSVKEALGIDVAISSDMVSALSEWELMYKNQATWVQSDVISLGLPAAIASEIARLVTIEMKAEISGSLRAEFLNQEFQREIMTSLRSNLEKGCAFGGMIFKPYVDEDEISVDFIHADQFIPVKFDSTGRIVSAIFIDQQTIGDHIFTRLEYHYFEGEIYWVINRAYKSTSKETLGVEVSLDSVEEWADLEPEQGLENIEQPLFGYFRYPLANNIDSSSPLGISCFERAKDLIKQADLRWSEFIWDVESAERALYVDMLAFKKNDDGKWILPGNEYKRRLYKGLNQSGQVNDDNLFEEWSPNIRVQEYLQASNAIYKRIEFNCFLSYGTLSDAQYIEKTATEINAAKQRSWSNISDIQQGLERALNDLVLAMNVWCDLMGLAPAGDFETVYEFDDSIITDKDVMRNQNRMDVSAGLLAKWEYRMQTYGESEEIAKERIAEISAEMPEDMF